MMADNIQQAIALAAAKRCAAYFYRIVSIVATERTRIKMLPFTRLILTALLVVIHVENAIPEADGASRRSLFIFYTGSYSRSDDRPAKISEKCTVLMYSPHPMLSKHARSVGANVAVSAGAPSNISNATARKE